MNFNILIIVAFVLGINSLYAKPLILCDATKGLQLLNQDSYSAEQVKTILEACDKAAPNNPSVLLLHGLFARKEASQSKQYSIAIDWLEKAKAMAIANDYTAALELADTYILANNLVKASETYQFILAHAPENRFALLGQARVFRLQNHWSNAALIYQTLLNKQPQDSAALNGMGWVKAQEKNLNLARDYFNKTLAIEPENQEALLALAQINATEKQQPGVSPFYSAAVQLKLLNLKKFTTPPRPPKVSLCDADQGLIMLNQKKPPIQKIQKILNVCAKNTPKLTSALLLRGLLWRHLANETKNYELAIFWLKKAAETAVPPNYGPALELAVTYEWSGEPEKALYIYQNILSKEPNNRAGLLGQARALRMQYKIPQSLVIYEGLLKKNPSDVDALNGKAISLMANYQFDQSRAIVDEALEIKPGNLDSMATLDSLSKATKYTLAISGGDYTVPPEHANALNVYFSDNINATDSLIVYATHNTKQIGEDFFSGPTLLPNNSFLLGYQHSIPNKYGWGINYDYRQHKDLPFENRILGTANLYLTKNFEWFNGLRVGYSSPWQNQLLYSGMTLYTSLPVNISFTGFWAHQEIGGRSSAYSLDFSKEFANRAFYNIGPSYSPTLKNWEVHGRFTLPTFTNQALIGSASHYFFNNSTFLTLGWQFYWA